MLILSLAYYLAPCLASTNLTSHIGNYVGFPMVSSGSSLQSSLGLALRQDECVVPGQRKYHDISFPPPLFSHLLILPVECPEDPTACCQAGYNCVSIISTNALGFIQHSPVWRPCTRLLSPYQ